MKILINPGTSSGPFTIVPVQVNVNTHCCNISTVYQERTVSQMVWGAPQAVIVLTNLSKVWLVLEFCNIPVLVKIRTEFNSDFIL